MNTAQLFPEYPLPAELIQDLRRQNPWWESKPQPPLPATRRHLVRQIRDRLNKNLAPLIVVRGPRQIGKTTAQRQVIEDYLGEGVPAKFILRVQFDELLQLGEIKEPILRIVDWYERVVMTCTLNEAARAGQPVYLFFDEVQNLKGWDSQLKALADASRTQAVVTGSSALRIEQGRDSLAGRITTVEASVLSLTEIAEFHAIGLGNPFLPDNGLEPLSDHKFWRELTAHGRRHLDATAEAFRWFSERGGYPLVHQRADLRWDDLANQLNETVIKRVIQHDLRVGDVGRKRDEHLLEEVFRLACRYTGQSPGPDLLARESSRALDANVGAQRIQSYLKFLGDTLLLRLIQPLEIRLKKKRGYPKICLADHGLRASWLQEVVPLVPDILDRQLHLSTLAGHLAESIVGMTCATIGSLPVAHLPARRGEPEIDFVLTVGTRRIPIEVKYHRRIDPLRDTEAMRTFLEKSVNNADFGLIITQSEAEVIDPRIISMPLSTFMLLR